MNRIVPILFLLLAVICLGSCKKDKGPETTYDKLLGQWRITEIGMDADNDGKMDNAEVKAIPINDVEYMNFGENGLGGHQVTFNGVANYYPFTWQLFNVTTDPESEGANLQRLMIGDTLVANIEALTEQRLVLRNHTKPAYSWYVMKKQ